MKKKENPADKAGTKKRARTDSAQAAAKGAKGAKKGTAVKKETATPKDAASKKGIGGSKRFGYVLNVMSDDHPGIVAGLSEGIARLGGNIESCSQTVLSGYFTLIMTLSFDRPWEPDALVADILTERGLEDCQIFARRMTQPIGERAVSDADVFVLTAFGEDRREIVLSFSRYLADKGVNIIDLYGERHGENEFVLIGQVEVDPRDDIRGLLLDLEEIGNDFGFTVKLQHKNIFVATNQLRLLR